jgi:hypothetical protein
VASGLYDKGREAIAGAVDLGADTIKVVLVHNSAGGTSYTVNLATDQFLSDVASGARVATSGALASKTLTAGVFDAADITLSAVTGVQVDAIVVYKDTGSAATSPLIAYIDTASSGLPVVPNGGDLTIQWDNGSNRIFKL